MTKHNSLDRALVPTVLMLVIFMASNPLTDLQVSLWASWIFPATLGLFIGLFASLWHFRQETRNTSKGLSTCIVVWALAAFTLHEGALVAGEGLGGSSSIIPATIVATRIPSGALNRCRELALVRLNASEQREICTQHRFRKSLSANPLTSDSPVFLTVESNVAGTWVTGISR